jgi:hypothetical protein
MDDPIAQSSSLEPKIQYAAMEGPIVAGEVFLANDNLKSHASL